MEREVSGLEAIDVTFDHVAKKQKLTADSTAALIDDLIAKFEGAKTSLTDGQETVPAALERLQTAVQQTQACCSQAFKAHGAAIAQLGRHVDLTFQELQMYQSKGWTAEPALCDQIVADHLYRVGLFDIGEMFEKETGSQVSPTLQAPFREMYEVLEKLKARQLQPALAWCEAYAQTPSMHSNQRQRLQRLLFQLHRLHAIQMLARGDRLLVVQYVQRHLGAHHSQSPQFARDIRQLLSAVLWSGHLETSPYPGLLDEALWNEAAYLFTTVSCSALGLPKDSNLAVCLAAGYLALPTLTKYAALQPRFRGALCDVQMPDFGPELQFHSTFACPVIQQVATPTNPPMLLPCQHVLSQSAVTSLLKAGGRLKCPYCPTDCPRDQCLVLHLYNPPGAPAS